jgi:hypothetical protein
MVTATYVLSRLSGSHHRRAIGLKKSALASNWICCCRRKQRVGHLVIHDCFDEIIRSYHIKYKYKLYKVILFEKTDKAIILKSQQTPSLETTKVG